MQWFQSKDHFVKKRFKIYLFSRDIRVPVIWTLPSGHSLVSKNVISDQGSANSNKHEWFYKVYLHMQLWKDLCFWYTVSVVEYEADASSI